MAIKIELEKDELQFIVNILQQVPMKGDEAMEELVALIRKLKAKLPKVKENAGS